MKSVFYHFFRWSTSQKWLPLTALFLLLAVSIASAQPLPSYSNTGTITTPPPQVDATNFFNSGTWNIIVNPTPYQTKDTLNYYNSGNMASEIGWIFDCKPASGSPTWSANFTNDNNGIISAASAVNLDSVTQVLPVGYLLISATNLVNKGMLAADANSQLYLNGSNVNLSRSKIQITPVESSISDNDDDNGTFAPSAAIYDEFWGAGTMSNINSSAIWTGTVADSSDKTFNIAAPCSTTGKTSIGFDATFAGSITITNPAAILTVTLTNVDQTTTNVFLPTNIVRQAVFIGTSDPNITAGVKFTRDPNSALTNFFDTAAVHLSAPFTNLATLAVQTSDLFLVDTLASLTNSSLYEDDLINPYSECPQPTFRPANYTFSRADDGTFAFGVAGAGVPTNNFLFQADFTNPIVNANYAAYSAFVDNQGVQLGIGQSITNLPGRVRITADNLNLNLARIRAEGEVMINASNLVSSTGAVIDCQNLSFNLGSATGLLNVTNLSGLSVTRLHGTVSEWSATWVNVEQVIFTNNFDTNGVSVPLTNYVQIGLYAWVIDASQLQTVTPVTVQDLVLHSTNIVVSDNVNVVNDLLFDGISLTINGDLSLGNPLEDWIHSEAPNLLYFTNNGTLSIPNNAHFGDDGPTNYISFVNNGNITANSEAVNSTYYQNSGIDSIGSFMLTAASGKIAGGKITSSQDIDFNAGSLKLNNATLIAGNTLNFNVSNSLFDAGDLSSNEITFNNGFNLSTKPATGDLLGTAFTSIASGGAEVDSTWAGEDRGATSAGFLNNVAIGKLILSPQGNTEPLFYFSGTGTSNALYVDDLDLSQLSTNYAAMLAIDPSLVIYYASAELGFTPPTTNGIPQEPEEFLNGQFNNHLRWVSSFAGPNSSVDVLINGQTVSVNRALRFSKIIDSNGNGIANFFDSNPFDAQSVAISGSLVQTNQPPSNVFGVSWTAFPNTIYQVQFATNLLAPNWLTLLSYTNNATTNQNITIWDTNTFSGQRFYRELITTQF